MSGPGKLYRVVDGTWLTGDEFLSSLFATVPTDTPEQPQAPLSRWYCPTEGCPVHEVTINAHSPYGPPVNESKMRCPNCASHLKFRGYRKTLVLVPEGKG